MGMFHLDMRTISAALFAAASLLQQTYPTGKISITLRCGGVRRHVLDKAAFPVTALTLRHGKMK